MMLKTINKGQFYPYCKNDQEVIRLNVDLNTSIFPEKPI